MPEQDATIAEEAIAGSGTPAARKTIEAWESEKDTPTWLRAAARALNRWPRGRELLEQEFDDGVKAAIDLALR
jgi:hypothetical protein